MPLLLVPYTLGTELPAAPGGTFGVGYYSRRRRFLSYILASLLLMLVA